MCTVYAITNKKGGVGKTTTCEQLADIASNLSYGYGRKVLGISIDPQGNWDNSLKIPQETPGIYEFVVNNADTRIKVSETLDFITCTNAQAIKAGLEQSKEPFAEMRLVRNLNLIKNEYDFVIIDCPPDENFLNNCVYAASDALIVPVTTDRYSVEGILELSNCIDAIKFLNSDLHLAGILMTKVKRNTQVEREAMLDAEECAQYLNTKVFRSTISLSTIIEKAQRNYQPLMRYAQNAKVTHEYRKFVDELLGMR